MTDPQLIRLTYQMRAAQIRFFAAKDDKEKRPAIREAKRLEKLVDAGLRERAPELEGPAAEGFGDVA